MSAITTFEEREAMLAEFSDEVCFELFVKQRMPRDREAELNHLMRYDLVAARRLLTEEAMKITCAGELQSPFQP